MSKEDRSTPRSKAGGVVFSEIQKAIRLFRINPPEHPSCARAIDESLEAMKKFVDRYGRLDAELTRDGLMIDDGLIVRTGDPTSDFSLLLFPLGFRSIGIAELLPRETLLEFVKVLAMPPAEKDGDVTFEPDLTAALWRRGLTAIHMRFLDPLSPGAIGGRVEASLAPVAQRIEELTASLGAATEADDDEARRFFAEEEKRVAEPGPEWWGARPEKLDAYLASPSGAGRRALAAAVAALEPNELLDSAARVAVAARRAKDSAVADADLAAFLGGAAGRALEQGNVDRFVALLEQAQDADAAGAVAALAGARAATDAGIAALVAFLEKQGATLSLETLDRQGRAILGLVGTAAVAPLAKLYPDLKSEPVRAVARSFFASRIGDAPEPIVQLTLASDKRVVSEALDVLAKGGLAGPGWKHLEAIARGADAAPRTKLALDLVERLSGEKEKKDHVRVIVGDPEKEKRLQATEQLRAGGGGVKAFDELAVYLQDDKFAARDEDEIAAVLGAFVAIGKLRSVRVLTALAEKKTLLFRRNETRKVAHAAQKVLEQLKGRGGA